MLRPVVIRLQAAGTGQVQGAFQGVTVTVGSLGTALRGVSSQAQTVGTVSQGAANRAGVAWRGVAGFVGTAGNALGKIAGQGRSAGAGIASGANQASGAIGSLTAKLAALDTKLGRVASHKFSNLKDAAGQATGIGQGMAVAGGVGVLGFRKTVQDAAAVESVKTGLKTTLGDEEAKKLFADVVEFDKNTTFGFATTAKEAQKLAGAGFKADEIMPLMKSVADAVVAQGGGDAELQSALRAIRQIKTNQKLNAEELNQLAEVGINAKGIIVDKFKLKGDQISNIGDQNIGADAAIAALQTGFTEKFGGATAAAADTLAGAAGQLDSALFKLSSRIGEDLAPTVKIFSGALTGLLEITSAIPDPIRQVLVSVGAIGVGLALLGGGFIMAVGFVANAVIAIASFNTALAAAGINATISAAGVMKFALTTVAALGLLAIAAYALHIAAVNSEKAAKMSEAQWRSQTGVFISISRGIGDIFDWIDDKIDWVRSKLNLGGQRQFDETQERGLYDAEKKRRAGRGETIESFEDWRAAREAKNKTVGGGEDGGDREEEARRKSAQPAAAPQGVPAPPDFSSLQKSVSDAAGGAGADSAAGGGAASLPVPVSIGGLSAMAPSLTTPAATATAPVSSRNFTAEIRALEDQKRSLKGKENAAAREAIEQQLVSLRRSQQDASRANADAKREQAARLKVAKGAADLRAEEGEAGRGLLATQIQENARIAAARNDAALEAEERRIEDAKDAKTLDERTASRKLEALRNAYKRRSDLLEAETASRLAAIEAENELERSRLEASAQIGAEREKTLRMGVLNANRILSEAKIKLNSAQEIATIGEQSDKTLGTGKAGLFEGARHKGADMLQRAAKSSTMRSVAGLMGLAAKEKNPEEQAYLLRQARAQMEGGTLPASGRDAGTRDTVPRPALADVNGRRRTMPLSGALARYKPYEDVDLDPALRTPQQPRVPPQMPRSAAAAYRGTSAATLGGIGFDDDALDPSQRGRRGPQAVRVSGFQTNFEATPDEFIFSFEAPPPVRVRRNPGQARAVTSRDVNGVRN